MALARIRTLFPDEVSALSEALVEAGYVVEIIRPNDFRIAPADLELTVDKLPVVDAWRHLPDAERIYIAPGTPESGDIRGSFTAEIARESLLTRLRTALGEKSSEISRYAQKQMREARAYAHDLRQRWTPPRDYHAPVYPAPRVERKDAVIEQARLHQEELRRRQEEERRELQEQARRAEENRRRAREAAEARALLESHRQIEAMLQATEEMRQRALQAESPKPRPQPLRRPRYLPRTRREKAFFHAGIVAFALAVTLAAVANAALHPRPAATAIPQVATSAKTVPASPLAVAAPVSPAASTPAVPAEVKPSPKPSGATLAAVRHAAEQSVIADDEVIVRKPRPSKPNAAKQKPEIAHYSDLD